MMTRILIILMALGFMLQGCALVRSIAGANIDREQYAKAREAAMLETRYLAAARQVDRMQRGFNADDADATLVLSERLVNDAMQKLRGRKGWLDRQTPYTIDSIRTILHPGSAIASLQLTVRSEANNVDVKLVMDCALAFIAKEKDLQVEMDPYNVVPAVQAPGLLAAAEDIIEDVIRVKLGSMKEEFPPVLMPLTFDDVFTIDGVRNEVRSKINVIIDSPRRMLAYKLKVKDLLIFDEMVLVTIALTDVKGR